MADKTQTIRDDFRKYLFSCIRPFYEEPLVIERGQGSTVVDSEGREYLDFFGGILVTGVGHCHPKVKERTVDQINKVQHTSNFYVTEPPVALAKKLAEITPGKLQKTFFTNSGSEADETAVLVARCYTDNYEVVAMRHGYAGRTTLAMSMIGDSQYRLPGAGLGAGVVQVANPYCYRCPYGLTYPECELHCARDVEEVIRTSTVGRIAAFVAEPIQGVGGFIVPPKEYFQVVAEIVRRYGGIFISDEVQTGFGRTGGKMFAIEHFDVEPEVMTMAKALGNGMPIGATIAAPEVADSIQGFSVSTYGGNPVSTETARAVLDVIIGEDLVKNAQTVGAFLRRRLDEMKERFPVIGDVRGMGLMQGMELVEEGKEPAPHIVNQIFEETRKRGLLIGKGGTHGNFIRVTPPLNVSRSDAEAGMKIFEESFEAIAGA